MIPPMLGVIDIAPTNATFRVMVKSVVSTPVVPDAGPVKE